MAVCYFGGIDTSSPYTSLKRVTLALGGYDVLELTGGLDQGYKSNLEGFLNSDGRTPRGSIQVAGGSYRPPLTWDISATVTDDQVRLFELLKAAQDKNKTPISLEDRFTRIVYDSATMNAPTWAAGYPETGVFGLPEGYSVWNVFVDVDSGWKTFQGGGFWTLQFSAKAIV